MIERAVALEATPMVLADSLTPAIRGRAAQQSAAAVTAVETRAGTGIRSRSARPGDRARLHRRSASPRRRRAGEGCRTARHEFPVVPLLREEIQPAVRVTLRGSPSATNCQAMRVCLAEKFCPSSAHSMRYGKCRKWHCRLLWLPAEADERFEPVGLVNQLFLAGVRRYEDS